MCIAQMTMNQCYVCCVLCYIRYPHDCHPLWYKTIDTNIYICSKNRVEWMPVMQSIMSGACMHRTANPTNDLKEVEIEKKKKRLRKIPRSVCAGAVNCVKWKWKLCVAGFIYNNKKMLTFCVVCLDEMLLMPSQIRHKFNQTNQQVFNHKLCMYSVSTMGNVPICDC